MNAVLSDPHEAEPTVQQAYDNAVQRRADARAKLHEAALALERGRHLLADAKERFDAAHRAAEAAQDRQARDLVHTLVSRIPIIGVPVSSDDSLALQLLRARYRHEITVKAFAAVEQAHAAAQKELTAAETAVTSAVDALIVAEWDALAADVVGAAANLQRAGELLQQRLPNPLEVRRSMPEIVKKALAALPPLDEMTTPIPVMRAWRTAGFVSDGKLYDTRRAQLMAGEPEAPASAAA